MIEMDVAGFIVVLSVIMAELRSLEVCGKMVLVNKEEK